MSIRYDNAALVREIQSILKEHTLNDQPNGLMVCGMAHCTGAFILRLAPCGRRLLCVSQFCAITKRDRTPDPFVLRTYDVRPDALLGTAGKEERKEWLASEAVRVSAHVHVHVLLRNALAGVKRGPDVF